MKCFMHFMLSNLIKIRFYEHFFSLHRQKNVSSKKSKYLMREGKFVPFPHRFPHCLSCPPSCSIDLDLQDSQQHLKIHKDPEVL